MRHLLTKDTAFISMFSADNNTTQSSFVVYTRGTIKYYNADNSFTLIRTAGDTTDTSAAYDIPTHVAAETDDVEAEFFCITKLNSISITRTSYQLNPYQEHLSSTDIIFLANGTVTVNSTEFAAPAVIETLTGTNILANQAAWIIELS